jgi:hypothetical protein
MSCEIKHIGETNFETVGSTVKLDNNGVIYAQYKYLLAGQYFTINQAQDWATGHFGADDENYGHLKCVNASCSTNGPFHEVTLIYQGVPQNAKNKVARVSASTTTEPIDTHPEFKEFGGDKEEPNNEAIFNDDGTFKAFKVHPSCPRPKNNNKAGIKSYLAPSMTYEIIAELGSPNNNNGEIGEITTTPDSHQPAGLNSLSVPKIGKRNWLVIGIDEQPFGKGARQTTKWRLSGRRKWNRDIYD